jgi:hypothetical protein
MSCLALKGCQKEEGGKAKVVMYVMVRKKEREREAGIESWLRAVLEW